MIFFSGLPEHPCSCSNVHAMAHRLLSQPVDIREPETDAVCAVVTNDHRAGIRQARYGRCSRNRKHVSLVFVAFPADFPLRAWHGD